MTDIEHFLTRHHDHLAAWLRDGERDRLDAFLTAHHDEFTLVTTEGDVLALPALRQALDRAGGSSPGLVIELDRITAVTDQVHRFVERHRVDGSLVAERIVTAVLGGPHLDGALPDGALLTVQETART
ncbi:hypothetical protein LY13_000050 [Prauserella aidingensis]|uniref:hypothetical protein n=1 Tax=Prauserella aidingensis TaxID=387890 RepID=UPI0020A37DD5|nr:hypothetical protein [Prauserella aidingensis]MCP2251322.1 hypothetical protein [Prauserella aidingensis]